MKHEFPVTFCNSEYIVVFFLTPAARPDFWSHVQRRANAMASVGPTPVKCHEPKAMALARSVICLELYIHYNVVGHLC
jgi:hypothetical protein